MLFAAQNIDLIGQFEISILLIIQSTLFFLEKKNSLTVPPTNWYTEPINTHKLQYLHNIPIIWTYTNTI